MRPAVPLILFNAPDAEKAFAVYQALLQLQRDKPELASNPYWEPVRDSAYARFFALYERV